VFLMRSVPPNSFAGHRRQEVQVKAAGDSPPPDWAI